MLDKQQFATDEVSAAREEIGIAERYFTEPAIDRCIPEHGRPARTAHTLLQSEMLLDGDPAKNLATFVTTWMEPEAREVIAENLHRNYIDHAEYPQTAEISKRCVRMLHELFHGEGEPDAPGAACAGSSEAVMLGALAMISAGRPRARRPAYRWTAPTSSMAPTCTSCGTSSVVTSTSSRGRCR